MKKSAICDMRGFLSFLILCFLCKKPMSGVELSREMESRRGCKPNPGTIYPALKKLRESKAVTIQKTLGREKCYAITALGKKEYGVAREYFSSMFCDALCKKKLTQVISSNKRR